MMNRKELNTCVTFDNQNRLIAVFRRPHSGIRLKGRRVCLVRENGENVFKFERASKWRIKVCAIPLSDEALDAMIALRSDARNKEEVEKHYAG